MTAAQIDSYLDKVAVFMCKHVPGYTDLSTEALNTLDTVWMSLAENRTEFIEVLDAVKSSRNRKKKVATSVA